MKLSSNDYVKNLAIFFCLSLSALTLGLLTLSFLGKVTATLYTIRLLALIMIFLGIFLFVERNHLSKKQEISSKNLDAIKFFSFCGILM